MMPLARRRVRYSHTPGRLDDLRKVVEIVRTQSPDEPDHTRNVAASRPRQWAMSDRLSPEDVRFIIDLYREGVIAKDVAAKFGISLSSVRRLIRKHGGWESFTLIPLRRTRFKPCCTQNGVSLLSTFRFVGINMFPR